MSLQRKVCMQTRRSFLKTAGMACASVPLAGSIPRCTTSHSRPNILFLMADDHAANAISCYGGLLSSTARTPNIDRIGADGVRLNNCFCTNAICTPSRACILTGEYSHRNGVYTLSDSFDPDRANVAKILQGNGYETAVIGKWHLKTDPSGFDYWNVLPGQGRYYNPILRGKETGEQVFDGYSADVITDLSLSWLQNRNPDKPFFLMTHFKAPHRAWQPPERFKQMYEDMDIPEPEHLYDDYENRSRAAADATLKIGDDMRESDVKQEIPSSLSSNELRQWAYQIYLKDYLRCIAAIDDNVGRLLDYLDAANLTENTIVIYTSDQGMFLGEHGYFDKRFMYEESLRMPFLIRYPHEVPAGAVNGDIVLNADFAPTFLDYAELAVPDYMQGRSFRPHLAGKAPEERRTSMYYRYWMHMAHHGVPAHYGIRTNRYKLIFFYGLGLGMAGTEQFESTKPEWELFDLEKDPLEMNNVYAHPEYEQVVSELKKELLQLKTELGDLDEEYPELMEVRSEYW